MTLSRNQRMRALRGGARHRLGGLTPLPDQHLGTVEAGHGAHEFGVAGGPLRSAVGEKSLQ